MAELRHDGRLDKQSKFEPRYAGVFYYLDILRGLNGCAITDMQRAHANAWAFSYLVDQISIAGGGSTGDNFKREVASIMAPAESFNAQLRR